MSGLIAKNAWCCYNFSFFVPYLNAIILCCEGIVFRDCEEHVLFSFPLVSGVPERAPEETLANDKHA